jgi:hypothetical protein
MNIVNIIKFYYKNYLHLDKISFLYLLVLSVITGILNGITLYLLFAYIQFLSSGIFANSAFDVTFIYFYKITSLSKNVYFLIVIFFSFFLKILFNGLYFLKSENFRINVSYYLSQIRINKSSSNIVSDLTVHLTKADTFNDLLLSLILQISSILFSIFMLFTLNFLITFLMVVVIAPIIYFSSNYFSSKIIGKVSNFNDKLYNYTDFLNTINPENQKSYQFMEKFNQKNLSIKKDQLNILRARFISTNFYEVLFFLIIFFLLIFNLSNKFIYLGIFVKIISSFQGIIQYNQKIQIRFESLKKFFS